MKKAMPKVIKPTRMKRLLKAKQRAHDMVDENVDLVALTDNGYADFWRQYPNEDEAVEQLARRLLSDASFENPA